MLLLQSRLLILNCLMELFLGLLIKLLSLRLISLDCRIGSRFMDRFCRCRFPLVLDFCRCSQHVSLSFIRDVVLHIHLICIYICILLPRYIVVLLFSYSDDYCYM
ncbi:hypothetical protein GIB67_009901 [Kingdonia uniflora]|uniref:Uncharacterized protein n=1 Tax=Kingdonia uniflora TaxID=39325 RepID=A0A7J7L464_9MAGN|nr:hypothetical protein GIB67_009901 [Kingdonia uniflora]